MFLYYLKLAVKSIASTPWLTALTVVAIGLGIAVPTTILSIHHVFAQNPIPEKSDVLYNVRVDSWDPDSEFFDVRPGDPPKHITYRDMAGLSESDIPSYRTGIASAAIFVFPEDKILDIMQPWVTTKAFGSGLGLPLVKCILEQHGGSLEITNLKPQGVTFTVWLADKEPSAQAT